LPSWQHSSAEAHPQHISDHFLGVPRLFTLACDQAKPFSNKFTLAPGLPSQHCWQSGQKALMCTVLHCGPSTAQGSICMQQTGSKALIEQKGGLGDLPRLFQCPSRDFVCQQSAFQKAEQVSFGGAGKAEGPSSNNTASPE